MQTVFGILSQNRSDWKIDISKELFGTNFEVELFVDGNDSNGTVLDEQINAMIYFKGNEIQITKLTEKAILEYYKNEVDPDGSMNSELMAEKVKLTGVIFPMVLNRGERVFGFLLECDWDMENGLAVKFEGDSISVGYQDLLT